MILDQSAVSVHQSVLDRIREHAQQENEKGSYEAVGFVAARKGAACGVATLRLNNHAANPASAFFVEPWEQYRAENTLFQRGYQILGIYHSHPRSEALPSNSDHRLAWPGYFVFIYSVLFDVMKAYKEVDGMLIPVDTTIEEEE